MGNYKPLAKNKHLLHHREFAVITVAAYLKYAYINALCQIVGGKLGKAIKSGGAFLHAQPACNVYNTSLHLAYFSVVYTAPRYVHRIFCGVRVNSNLNIIGIQRGFSCIYFALIYLQPAPYIAFYKHIAAAAVYIAYRNRGTVVIINTV